MLELGGPRGKHRDGSHGPAHASYERWLPGSLPEANARKSNHIRKVVSGIIREWEVKCDQYFSSTLVGEDRRPAEKPRISGSFQEATDSFLKGLILAQNERWRRGLGMQVERTWFSDQVSGVRVSKATATNPMVGHNRGKLRIIPSDVRVGHPM